MIKKILFVCTGNICRSPIAEGIFSKLVTDAGLQEAFLIDSAGTMAWNSGNPPDPFAQAALIENGIDISNIRARKLNEVDLDYFDLVLVSDDTNYQEALAISSNANQKKIQYLMSYAETDNPGVIPDPYGGGIEGFLQVSGMIENACIGLLKTLKQEIA